MFRWLAACVLLAGGAFGAVYLLSGMLTPSAEGAKPPGAADGPGAAPAPAPAPRPSADEGDGGDDSPVRVVVVPVTAQDSPLVIEAKMLPEFRQEVPSERDGKLLALATLLKPGEVVPEGKLIKAEVGVLAVKIQPGDGTRPDEELIPEDAPAGPGRFRAEWRRVRDTDELRPDQVKVFRRKVDLRRLEVGDRVRAGELVALVNPALALDELRKQVDKLKAADADRLAARKTKEEWERRHREYLRAGAAITKDDVKGAELSAQRYAQEEIAKAALVRQTQSDLSSSLTLLKMHEIRAMTDGVIKVMYKNRGDAVKNLEPVLQIQDPKLLRVEGLVDVQDAAALRRRLARARQLGEQAKREPAEKAKALEAEARRLLAVVVEASRPEAPLTVLKGHLHEVTAVAVGTWRGPKPAAKDAPRPVIVSGSEDHMVRLWERGGDGQWRDSGQRLEHPAVVRAVACTDPKAKESRLLTGTSAGQGYLFRFDDLTGSQTRLDGRHRGAVTCVAFSPDGTLCATGGDDRVVCVWDAATGKRLARIAGAHRQPLTALQFLPTAHLVSAGGDKRLLVWEIDGVRDGKAPKLGQEFDRRGGTVAQPGVSPDGKSVLFDDGRELRVLDLATKKLEGVLRNPPGAAAFAHFALFSPDGKTVLTGGDGPGHLQLWRAPSAGARAAELRQLVWSSAPATCGAFAPDGSFAVTGTQDNRVLVWATPSKAEADKPLVAELSYVEEFLDSSLKRVPVRAKLSDPPDWLTPGGTATMVIPPAR